MKQAFWLIIIMYLLGMGPCGRRIERVVDRPQEPRVRLLPLFRPREEPEVSKEIKWDGNRQYIMRHGVKHYVAWVGEKPVYSCSGSSCGSKQSIIYPGK